MARYFEFDYNQGIVKEYARSGECNGCGQCCQAGIYFTGIVMASDIQSARDGGYATDRQDVWNAVIEQDGKRPLFFKFKPIDVAAIAEGRRCPLLTKDIRCAMYAHRAKICSTWPIAPQQVEQLDQCSYKFEFVREYTLADWYAEFGELDKQLNVVEQENRAAILRGWMGK